jgi:NAD(P)-dependent dehydrogenase (short-subunit alcohol dehydrogenase family)
MSDLKNKTILITGASSGIGRAIAILAAKAGAGTLICCGRDTVRLEEIQNSIGTESFSTQYLQFAGDFSQGQSIIDLVSFIKEKGITLDGVVYSAGVDKMMPFKLLSEKILSGIIFLNTIVPIETTRQLLKANLINQNASIVFLSSVMGFVGQPGQVAYSASKGGLISSARSLSLELAPSRIRVNVLTPGIVMTELTEKLFGALTPQAIEEIRKMHPLGFGDPEDVANLVLFLFSNKAKWITGSTFTIDGGYSAH